MLKTSAVSVEF